MNFNDPADRLIKLSEHYLNLAERFLRRDWDFHEKSQLGGFKLVHEVREHLRIGFFFPNLDEAGRNLLYELRWAQCSYLSAVNPYQEAHTDREIEAATFHKDESAALLKKAKDSVSHSLWPLLTPVQQEILSRVYFSEKADSDIGS